MAREVINEVQGYCAHCKSKCGTVAFVQNGRLLAVRPDRQHPNHGFCIKGASAPDIVYNDGRLKYPLRRTTPKTDPDPGWVRISWEDALSEVTRRLTDISWSNGPEAVAFSRPAPGGSHATDWAKYVERLADAFGSPNMITTSHICQWGRESGSVYTYGTGLPDPHFEAAQTILIWGHNPANSHVQNWWRIREAQGRGARLIVIDPRRTASVAKADIWVRPKPGTDTALALGLVHLLIRDGRYDAQFLSNWTNGPFLVDVHSGRFLRWVHPDESTEAYVVIDRDSGEARPVDVRQHPRQWGFAPLLRVERTVRLSNDTYAVKTAFELLAGRAAGYPPELVAGTTGVPRSELESLAEAIAAPGPLAYYTYNGVEQHIDTAQTSRAICILYGLTGWLDREGGNVNFAGGERHGGKRLLPVGQASKRLGLEARPLGPARKSVQAYTFYDAVLTGRPYPVRALMSFGGNLLLQNGDTLHGRDALQRLDFYCHMDLFENPSSRFADLLLPASTPWESPALSTSFSGGPSTAFFAQYRPPVIEPLHESRPDVDVIFDVACRLGLADQFWNGSLNAAFSQQLTPLSLTLEDLKAHPGGLAISRQPVFGSHEREAEDGTVPGFPTASRKVELYSELFLEHGYDPLPQAPMDEPLAPEFPLILTSSKLLQYCHSQGRGIPALRRKTPHPYVEVHPLTASGLGLVDGDTVAIHTPRGAITMGARLTDSVAPGVVATQTGWWEACEELGLDGYDPFSQAGANVNLIMTNELLDPISGSVPVKSYPCRIEKLSNSSTKGKSNSG